MTNLPEWFVIAVHLQGIAVGFYCAWVIWGQPKMVKFDPPFYGMCMACMGDVNPWGHCNWCAGFEAGKKYVEHEFEYIVLNNTDDQN